MGLKQILPPRPIEYGIIFCQIFAYLTLTPFNRLFFQVKRIFPKNWDSPEKGTLFVSNHQTMIDPFVVFSSLPFRDFLRITPVYFPVDHDYYLRFYLRPFLKLLGSYDIGGSKKEKLLGLLKTREIIRQGRTVFLFPEGKINKENVGEFQRGIEFFTKESKAVVFIRIENLSMRLKKLLKKKPVLKFSRVQDPASCHLTADDLRLFLVKL